MRNTAVIEPSQTLVGANQIANILKPALLNYKMVTTNTWVLTIIIGWGVCYLGVTIIMVDDDNYG